MTELSARARELTQLLEIDGDKNFAAAWQLIEQALLRERRLAMEAAAKIAEEPIVRLVISRDKAKAAGRECVSSCRESDIETRYAITKALRAAGKEGPK